MAITTILVIGCTQKASEKPQARVEHAKDAGGPETRVYSEKPLKDASSNADEANDASFIEADAEADETMELDVTIKWVPDGGSAARLESDATGSPPSDGGDVNEGSEAQVPLPNGPGCADGTREGLFDGLIYPHIAACAGEWDGDVANAVVLCEEGFHVCLGNEAAVGALTFEQATEFAGCFAFDAVQDNGQCLPDCSVSEMITSRGWGLDVDMAGIGTDCGWKYNSYESCLASGRVDASENSGTGCAWHAGVTGTVCCADE